MEVNLTKIARTFASKEIKYELSALIDADSFFYGLLDYGYQLGRSGKISLSEGAKIQSLADGEMDIRKTKLAFVNNLITCIPKEEYVSADASKILMEVCKGLTDLEGFEVRSVPSMGHDVYLTYAIPKVSLKQMGSTFEDSVFQHFAVAYFEKIDTAKGDLLHVCKLPNHLLLIAVKGGVIKLFNVYNCTDSVTALYYINLAHYNVFGEKASEPLMVSGLLDEGSETLNLIQQYFEIKPAQHSFTIDGRSLEAELMYYPLLCISEL